MTGPQLNYFALEPLLTARVQEAAGTEVRVISLADLGDPGDRMQQAPAVFVGYAGDALEDQVTGAHQRWSQEWWTVLAVRTARQRDQAQVLREEAGPVLSAIIGALSGWTPDRAVYRPLARVAGNTPAYYIGYVEIPLRWQTVITMRQL